MPGERAVIRVRLEGINTIRKRLADGTVKIYHYHRATGMRLTGEPGSAEFIASYGDAEKTIRDQHVGGSRIWRHADRGVVRPASAQGLPGLAGEGCAKIGGARSRQSLICHFGDAHMGD